MAYMKDLQDVWWGEFTDMSSEPVIYAYRIGMTVVSFVTMYESTEGGYTHQKTDANAIINQLCKDQM